ncbi:MAG: hypothetical protein A2498_03905 [Lentisphaerae bacterium RIFOXYC12_FULL_60_16]|nr:MAG: hypothetical protein A2498_03905 [Lentisphaerae bacterium RIFOXYC12_FULL_60_16]OGV83708.1 MAG: hypothetical protein A2340_03075 [Lentisphaerae bacterium RIFOXYB12_FULL_60_10]
MVNALRSKQGFTLIEILVAVVILVLIVLMMSTLFHQSAIAWDSGSRKVEGNVQARCLLALITRELVHAVSDGDVFDDTGMVNGANKITFFTLEDPAGNLMRVAKEVTFSLSGGTITRSERRMNLTYNGWDDKNSTNDMTIMKNATDLRFYMSGIRPPDAPPPWVRVELTMTRQDDVSSVGARSFGPDGKQDLPNALNKDDIVSW